MTTGYQYYRPGELKFTDIEWDPIKAESNVEKHEIAFVDVVKHLRDPDRIEIETPQLRDGEFRWQTSGFAEGRLITVIYTRRGENVRIISARKASRHERREYRSSSVV